MNLKKLKLNQIDILLSSLIGKEEVIAKDMCNSEGYFLRIVKEDERKYSFLRIVKEDERKYSFLQNFKFDRINVIIENNIIISAKIG